MLKVLRNREFELFYFFKYLAEVGLDWEMRELSGPETYGLNRKINQLDRVLLIFF